MIYTKKSYTSALDAANLNSGGSADDKLAKLDWEPGTHDALCNFPDGPRGNLGYQIFLLQKGEVPLNSTSVPGMPGLVELRDDDERAWYRIIVKRVGNIIHVIHCFEKQSNKIEKRDLRTIEQRLGALNQRLAEEKRHDKRRNQ
jgi:phage-related protein